MLTLCETNPLDDLFDELVDRLVVIIHTKVKAVKYYEGINFTNPYLVFDQISDLLVGSVHDVISLLLRSQSRRFFKSISYLMVEIDLLLNVDHVIIALVAA